MSTPTLDETRRLAKRHGLDRCVVFYTTPDGQMGYTSYGADRALCRETRQVADRMYDAAHRFFATTRSKEEDAMFLAFHAGARWRESVMTTGTPQPPPVLSNRIADAANEWVADHARRQWPPDLAKPTKVEARQETTQDMDADVLMALWLTGMEEDALAEMRLADDGTAMRFLERLAAHQRCPKPGDHTTTEA